MSESVYGGASVGRARSLARRVSLVTNHLTSSTINTTFFGFVREELDRKFSRVSPDVQFGLKFGLKPHHLSSKPS